MTLGVGPLRRFLIPPVIVSLLVVAFGAVVLTMRGARGGGIALEAGDALRILSWDLNPAGAGAGLDFDPKQVAAVIRKSGALLVALQGLSSRPTAEEIAANLGRKWRSVVVPASRDEGRFLAVLIHPTIEVTSRRLIETHAPQFALALELRTPGGPPLQLICLRADETDPQHRRSYVRDVTAWFDAHATPTTVLLGPWFFGTDQEAVKALTDRFEPLAPQPPEGGTNSSPRAYGHPQGARLGSVSPLDLPTGGAGDAQQFPPILIELTWSSETGPPAPAP